MPELPEVETIRRALEPALTGRRVRAVQASAVVLREGIRPAEWAALVGERLERIDRRGKYLLARFGERTALIHLGMSGRLTLRRPEAPRAPHTHLALAFDGDVELRLVDPRRFGVAVVLDRAGLAAHAGLGRQGIEPLAPGAVAALRERARSSRVPIRNLLLDQTVLAGIGNIYANEALARSGIHPLRRAGSISETRLARLADAVSAVLERAIRAGGTTLADGGYVDAAGEPGLFAVELLVYGREGAPCATCGSPIRRRADGNRSAFFCPRCQR